MAPIQMNGSSLIDLALLEGLSEAERKEALAAAAAAKRAEERAEERALQRALERREQERRQQADTPVHQKNNSGGNNGTLVFVSKRQRQKQKEEAAAAAAAEERQTKAKTTASAASNTASHTATTLLASSVADGNRKRRVTESWKARQPSSSSSSKPAPKKAKGKKATFRFRWDDTDDTFGAVDDDPLYNNTALTLAHQKRKKRQQDRDHHKQQRIPSIWTKPVEQMTVRDWRIVREQYEIHVRGGQAPPPLRSFDESPAPQTLPRIHPKLLKAIHQILEFQEPSPIQRQAIPVGLQRRDMIGIAETGSGKTIAFGIPLCHYLLQLPSSILQRVADEGPLALILAPTRELALQIEVELSKLLTFASEIKSCPMVGGQPIQQQAQRVRQGVHIIVGTPGRINDCIEMAYLVLNQCCYVVLDEADRMVDMGFKPQLESILDSMGGMLKSGDDELRAYQQEQEDLQNANAVARYRITAMFSATMPPDVELIAKDYLRYPAHVSIGSGADRKSGSNSRIVQKLVWVATPAQKERALIRILGDSRFLREKVIVFVNEKKHAEGVGRMVERAGRSVVILHGGKTQEQREDNLEAFRRGGPVLVATDVAGRGLDIPDVAHVINFDLPARSIESYTHRIGRTGRAGKQGLATSLVCEETDQGILPDLKGFLQSSGQEVPDRLKRMAATDDVGGNPQWLT